MKTLLPILNILKQNPKSIKELNSQAKCLFAMTTTILFASK